MITKDSYLVEGAYDSKDILYYQVIEFHLVKVRNSVKGRWNK